MADEVSERLLYLDGDAGNLAAKFGEQFLDDLVAVPAAVRIDAQDVFTRVHRRRVLIHFRPTCTPHEMNDFAVWLVVGLLEPPQLRVDEGRHLIRGVE